MTEAALEREPTEVNGPFHGNLQRWETFRHDEISAVQPRQAQRENTEPPCAHVQPYDEHEQRKKKTRKWFYRSLHELLQLNSLLAEIQ